LEPAVQSVHYNRGTVELRRAIALLLRSAYPTVAGQVADPAAPDHEPSLDAISFFVLDGDRVVSYAGVVHLTIRHGGEVWTLAGLSAVATAPEFRGRGLATAVVSAATRHIEQGTTDIGLFTCDPPLAALYQRAGWTIAPDARVVGSHDPEALTSDGLGKVVFMRLISARARTSGERLLTGTLSLGLPVGQFL
jgi:GNAT superfamily N-acetyltransferase